MHYDNNRPKYIRYAIYTAVIVFAAVLQNSLNIIPEIFGARAFILLPLCVCIAMFEREIASAVFGAVAGVLWDVSAGQDGFNAFVLLLIGAVCSLLISHFMRRNVLTAAVLGAGSIAVYNILYVLINLMAQGSGGSVKELFVFYLLSGIYTMIFVPVGYFLVSYIHENHKTADE
ncbi:MAG: rod shape-determining protein MreD [Clostridia bacterium]|nr:rod shape-determining protein MreD [Clostridia bacterium]